MHSHDRPHRFTKPAHTPAQFRLSEYDYAVIALSGIRSDTLADTSRSPRPIDSTGASGNPRLPRPVAEWREAGHSDSDCANHEKVDEIFEDRAA
jgi:hypothetical protein